MPDGDVFFDYDVASGREGYQGAAAINVMCRKNDQSRRGHHPRLGRSRDDALDAVAQLRLFMQWAGTTPGPLCTKAFPLFPPLQRRGHGRFEVLPDCPSSSSSPA